MQQLIPGVYGLTGANGAGKTTLMRSITGSKAGLSGGRKIFNVNFIVNVIIFLYN